MKVVDNNYIDRLEGALHEEITQEDTSNIRDYFNDKFGISKSVFDNSIKLHTALIEKLEYKSVDSELDLIQYLDNTGVRPIDLDKIIYVIWESPNQISKLKVRELHRVWEEVWCPPEDDAILIYLKDEKTILITHYDSVYSG